MSDDKHHEIVIIRRGGHGDHEEHHGGVWKIAFADFMTAMMAFFLVMWLISANDKTRASVARYFNPVRLVDATTKPRGLHDTKKDESGITASPDSKDPPNDKSEASKASTGDKPTAGSESPAQAVKRLDAALRENPLAALAEIAAAKGPGDRAHDLVARAPTSVGRLGGEAFRDPFAPPAPGAADSGSDDDVHGAKANEGSSDHDPIVDLTALVDPNRKQPIATLPPANVGNETQTDKTRKDEAQPQKPQPEQTGTGAAKAEGEAEAKAVLAALRDGKVDGAGPKVDVHRTSEGLVLSLTDTANFAMFTNGSAVPDRKVIALMETVAHVIQGRKGTVIVRGFTDSKPFRSGRYDNWHLSLDRAQTAHYMLVRGGLDDARIAHVEGYADRSAKSGVDPASPLNRRIEILLQGDAR